MKKGLVLLFLILLPSVLGVNTLTTIDLHFTPKVGGSLSPTTSFAYVLNITNQSDCSQVINSTSVTLSTDSEGRIFYEMDITGASTPNYLCEYRDGTLRKIHTLNPNLFDGAVGTWGSPLYYNTSGRNAYLNMTIINNTIDDRAPSIVGDSWINESGDTMTGLLRFNASGTSSFIDFDATNSIVSYDTYLVNASFNTSNTNLAKYYKSFEQIEANDVYAWLETLERPNNDTENISVTQYCTINAARPQCGWYKTINTIQASGGIDIVLGGTSVTSEDLVAAATTGALVGQLGTNGTPDYIPYWDSDGKTLIDSTIKADTLAGEWRWDTVGLNLTTTRFFEMRGATFEFIDAWENPIVIINPVSNYIEFYEDIRPSDTTSDVGQPTKQWRNSYIIGNMSNGTDYVDIHDFMSNWDSAKTDTDTKVAGSDIYLYNDSSLMYLNETKLNATIDDRAPTSEEPQINTSGLSKGNVNMGENNMTYNNSEMRFIIDYSGTDVLTTYGLSRQYSGFFGIEAYNSTDTSDYNNYLGGMYTPIAAADKFYYGYDSLSKQSFCEPSGSRDTSGCQLEIFGYGGGTGKQWCLYGGSAVGDRKSFYVDYCGSGPGQGGDFIIDPAATTKSLQFLGDQVEARSSGVAQLYSGSSGARVNLGTTADVDAYAIMGIYGGVIHLNSRAYDLSFDSDTGNFAKCDEDDLSCNFTKIVNQDHSHGELYNHSASGWTLPIASDSVYYNITNMTLGLADQMTETNDKLVIQNDGVYLVNYGISFGGGASNEYHVAVDVNNEEQDKCEISRKLGTGGDVGNAGTTCLLSLSNGDEVGLQIEDETNPASDVTIYMVQLTLTKIR